MKIRITALGLAGLTAVYLIAAFAVKGRITFPERSSNTGVSGALPEPLQGVTGERGSVQLVRFILFDVGIHPREARVKPGLINIAIEDKTNTSPGLVLERVTGNERSRVGEVRRFQNHWRGRRILRLLPGRYDLYDADKPANRALLIVEP